MFRGLFLFLNLTCSHPSLSFSRPRASVNDSEEPAVPEWLRKEIEEFNANLDAKASAFRHRVDALPQISVRQPPEAMCLCFRCTTLLIT